MLLFETGPRKRPPSDQDSGIVEEDIPRTAFNTRYGHYEWLVMSYLSESYE